MSNQLNQMNMEQMFQMFSQMLAEQRENRNDSLVEVPKYFGEADARKAKGYLAKFNAYIEERGIQSDSKKVQMFGNKLFDAALDWYDEVRANSPDLVYYELEDRFQKRFVPAGWLDELRMQYRGLKQKGSISEYAARFQSLRAQLPASHRDESGAVEDFVEGLRVKTRVQVKMSRPTTLEEAIELALALDPIIEAGNQMGYSNPFPIRDTSARVSNGQPRDSGPKAADWLRPDIERDSGPKAADWLRPARDPDAMDIDRLNARFRNFVCHKCGKTGHIKKLCPKNYNRQH